MPYCASAVTDAESSEAKTFAQMSAGMMRRLALSAMTGLKGLSGIQMFLIHSQLSLVCVPVVSRPRAWLAISVLATVRMAANMMNRITIDTSIGRQPLMGLMPSLR